MPRYVIYARKSTESEDRQVLSIDSQVNELKRHAAASNLEVVRVFIESRSAKAPGRAVFAEMLQELGRGLADGILCWKLDRLARNPVDGGALIWAVEEGKVTTIATPGRSLSNNGNDKFWMQLEFGMAKKYVDDLSDNVKRGNRAKLEQGWLPGVPPLGYLNERATKTIVKDPDRFALVRRMWDLLLSGVRPPRIIEMANDEWGLRSPVSRRRGGGRVARSRLYRMFANPFYQGLIVRDGVTYEGAHEPMVTPDEFVLGQRILGRPERPRPKHKEWTYTGLIRCGECGASVTAEEKINRYGYHYVYYHCTKRKRGTNCRQRVIRLETLEAQVMNALARVSIDDTILAWSVRNLHKAQETTRQAEYSIHHSLEAAHSQATTKISRLTDLRLVGLISDEEYRQKREELVQEKHGLHTQLAQAGLERTGWFEPSQRTFVFANHLAKRFQEGSPAEKREILVAVGSHLSLKDGILRMDLQKPFELIDEGRRSRNWCAISNKVRTYFMAHPHSIQWPAFCKDPQVLQRLKRNAFRRVTPAKELEKVPTSSH